ncbi:pilus assembly protein [Endozoicomonas acroporae]|uniref:pilus assembly protein n=1 Tax=Endozoicomonas acroporae TaxID=1701104 RepID=UPI003D7C062F
MDRYTSHGVTFRQVVLFGLLVLLSFRANAEAVSSDYAATPPLISNTSEPLVMLVMSVDHELFKKAYSDYTDLNSDGRLDTSYVDSFDYLGYFDSGWCYQYASGRYSPVVQATGDHGHYCTTSQAPWSGNFLNWATMTRMDILRTVLFGGKRSTDTDNQTILERAYVPRDVHAFVKVYRSSVSGIPTENFTPFSNSEISLCNVAGSENGTPEVRVAREAWPRWASTEERQCQWGRVNSPSTWYRLTTNDVYIEACVTDKDAVNTDRCKLYSTGKSKPIGLLQQYGESGDIRFGLISGSYDKNISGGVLRRNISKIAGNAQSSVDEIELSSGRFTSVEGIIHNINQFRLAKYSFSQNKYTDCNSYGISVSAFKSSRGTYSSSHCSMWGNPLAELYLEALRYFAGETTATSSFDTTNDRAFVSNLSRESWANPMSTDNACANCSIIVLSTGLNSFDTDQLSSSSDLPGMTGTSSVNSKTDEVGDHEYGGSFAGHYLVGGTSSTRQCTAKYLSGLSDAVGLCPEIPQLEGGYQVSGLAFHGNTTDLRTDLDGNQRVKTYAIELAETMPSFTLNVDGRLFTFQPVCQTSANFGSGSGNFSGSGSDCTLTDVVVEKLILDGTGQVVEGALLFTWEDSLWGNDYDYDASSRIKFCVGSQCNQTADSTLNTIGFNANEVRVAVQVDGVFAGLNMRFSYTATGSSGRDGLQTDYAYKGTTAFKVTDFTASGAAAGVLPKPLFLAAKYGGFIDLDGDGSPNHDADGDGSPDSDDHREWDNRNNVTGALGSDGLPDNYFFARNPALLASQLGQVLEDISSRVSSATNAALFANSSTGTGAIYQALFQPSLDINGKSVTWGGILHSLFIDSKGYIREDGNGNAQLDDYRSDKIVELFFDPNAGQTMVQRYTSDDFGVTRVADGPLKSLASLETIWDAREQLALLSDLTNQRSYDALASGGRHMLTWLDINNNQQVDDDEQLPFMPSTFTGHEGYLGVSASEVATVVNYVRGEEQAGTRSRTIDFDEDGIDEVWRLGDIVHSTPKLVAAPDSRYDAYYNDSSYRTFRNQYLNRRHVLYVGANDGLIHAFNGGFWEESYYRYERTASNGEVQHPLGSELWSYAPMNLLPHLRWLTETDYPHVYYMDSEPMVFDANIFADDIAHPGGWGTVLVVGMRLGGGNIDVTIDSESRTMRSAWVVLDITDPEQPPALLAEITHADLGFTTSQPALVKRRKAGTDVNGETDWSNPVQNEWYLVFGSGPAGSGSTALRSALEQGTSDQNLRVFVYDLNHKNFVAGFDPLVTSYSTAYAGDMVAEDWDRDYQDDAVYFGTVETGGAGLSGKLMRLRLTSALENSSLNVLMDAGQPIMAPPMTVTDDNSFWVYSGTGRLLTNGDNRSTESNYFYGVQEPLNSSRQFTYASVSQSNLVNVGDVVVFTNGDVLKKSDSSYTPFTVGSRTINSFGTLQAVVVEQGGWKLPLSVDGSGPAGRSVNSAARLFSQILFTEYRPPADSCSIDGTSSLNAVHYLTGTASPDAVLGSVPVESLELERSLNKVSLGIGYASSPVAHQGEGGKLTAVTQGAGGSITATNLDYSFSSEGRQSWWQIFSIPWID